MALPPERAMLIPLIQVIVPNVARMGETLILAIRKPLKSPISSAAVAPAARTSGKYTMLSGRDVTVHAITSAQALVDGIIDKLIPPVIMVMAMAKVRNPSRGTWAAMDWKLLNDQNKSGIVTLKKRTAGNNRTKRYFSKPVFVFLADIIDPP